MFRNHTKRYPIILILDVIDVLNEFYNVDGSDGWCGPDKAHKKSKLDRPAQNTELLN